MKKVEGLKVAEEELRQCRGGLARLRKMLEMTQESAEPEISMGEVEETGKST